MFLIRFFCSQPGMCVCCIKITITHNVNNFYCSSLFTTAYLSSTGRIFGNFIRKSLLAQALSEVTHMRWTEGKVPLASNNKHMSFWYKINNFISQSTRSGISREKPTTYANMYHIHVHKHKYTPIFIFVFMYVCKCLRTWMAVEQSLRQW